MQDSKKVFVSHASSDKILGAAFVEKLLRLGCGVPIGDIFFSSHPETATLPGKEDFILDIKAELNQAKLIILLLSENFYASEFCLAELGATWILAPSKSVFAITVPPIEGSKLRGVLQVMQVCGIRDSLALNGLQRIVAKTCQISLEQMLDWERQKFNFLDEVEELIQSLPKPLRITTEDHEEMKRKATIYKQERDEERGKLQQMRSLYEQVSRLKDKHDVAQLEFDRLPENDQFDFLLGEVQGALNQLPSPVSMALYREYIGKKLSMYDGFEQADFDELEQSGYLSEYTTNEYELTRDLTSVEEADEALDKLEHFLATASEEFKNLYKQKHKYAPSLKNIEFWYHWSFLKR